MGKYAEALRRALLLRSSQGQTRVISWDDLLAETVAPKSYRESPALFIRHVLVPSCKTLGKAGLLSSYEVVRETKWFGGLSSDVPVKVVFHLEETE